MTSDVKQVDAKWTADQLKAIQASGSDILVAAAAGSGKTAVLVERIIQKVIDKQHPVDVDRLLIVTFTNAAAAEMRKRIGEALETALASDPASLHLRRQLSLLNRAPISTLHSFCMDVLRKYYYKIGIDPSFRIVDDTEAELIKEEVMEEILEEEYRDTENEPFYRLIDCYSNDRSDTGLHEIIRHLYNFAQAHPWPYEWLDQIAKTYEQIGDVQLDELPWLAGFMQDIELQIKSSKQQLIAALAITKEPGGPAPYADNLLADLAYVEQLLAKSKQSWQALYSAFQADSFGKLKSCKKGETDETLQQKVKDLRDEAKKQLGKLKEELFMHPPEKYSEDMKAMAPLISTLISLVKKFAERFKRAKRDKGLVDFNDLEHDCLALLCDKESETNEIKPTDVARELKRTYAEVLVDEYQDTNLVQETIVSFVTTGNNLFMVGDVKQSIYRFRLAEPRLFLTKYKQFSQSGEKQGLKIDLSKNFRSRQEVLNGTNYLFKQIMDEAVGEIDYDEQAELKVGASFPEARNTATELLVLSKSEEEEQEASDLETVELEAKAIASKIKQCIRGDYVITDKQTNQPRAVQYRDIVILLRSFTWAPAIMDELKKQGIRAYAELSTGYFEATEVAVMLSVLKIIDNPYQDIPLVSVLRSPIVGLTEEELAQIRISKQGAPFYDALKTFCESQTHEKLEKFFEQLSDWRARARQGSLAELIWQIYRDTRYYDFVGGISGGKQRQANLKALYDRARQYESTSFRGLFRFLRFVERMQERGDDLGAARALGEQEDVVRLMTIHKSKGLEFPIVFVAGLNKPFNVRDMHDKVLLHKELGFGTKFIDPLRRISYPTLPLLAIKRKIQMELLAEEMRILYVALTRAKEKLFLVGTVKDREKALEKWHSFITHQDWLLPDYARVAARSYLDWIGPAVIRHQDVGMLRGEDEHVPTAIENHPSKWRLQFFHANDFTDEFSETVQSQNEWSKRLQNLEPVQVNSDLTETVTAKLSWQYPYQDLAYRLSKQTVTEIKRQRETIDVYSDHELIDKWQKPINDRPRFLQAEQLTAAEKGTAMHLVMQHVDISKGKEITSDQIAEQIAFMRNQELLTEVQAEAIDIAPIVAFFQTDIGQQLLHEKHVYREVPFSLGLPAAEIYQDVSETNEQVLLQGIIDLLLDGEDGITLIDYKTDRIQGHFNVKQAELIDKYRVQVELYTRAVEQIWKKQVKAKYLYFFDGGHLLAL